MDEERHQKAKVIFLRALEMDEGDRGEYLVMACDGDEKLRCEVLRLIDSDAEATGRWEECVQAQIASQLDRLVPTVVSHWPIGEMFGERYLIQKELGRGGIGAVYLGTDIHVHSRPVVIKLLLDSSSQNHYLVDKFKHEGEGLRRINHPGVVDVFDLGVLPNGKPYLVMKFVGDKTLAHEIQPGGMDFQRAALFVRQIAQALTAAHFEEVIHRDLKPANVVIQTFSDKSEQATLIDFGIAKIANPQSANATLIPVTIGSPAYMSPEQVEQRELSPACDIYALGLLAYEVLTGSRPFNVNTKSLSWTTELVSQQRAGVSRDKLKEARADLPRAAQEEILKALSYNPEHRHQRAFEFGESLHRALTGAKPETLHIGVTELAVDLSTQVGALSFDAHVPTTKPLDRASVSFERFWSNSTFTDRIRPLSLKAAKEERLNQRRGLGGKPKRAKYSYRLGDELCLAFDINRNGFLTLLDQGAEDIIYCLCPSQFAPNARIKSGRFYLPQEASPFQAFELSGAAGKEKLLAIVSDEPLGLEWLPTEAETPARVLSGEDVETLFVRLQQLGEGRWTAFSSYFAVID